VGSPSGVAVVERERRGRGDGGSWSASVMSAASAAAWDRGGTTTTRGHDRAQRRARGRARPGQAGSSGIERTRAGAPALASAVVARVGGRVPASTANRRGGQARLCDATSAGAAWLLLRRVRARRGRAVGWHDGKLAEFECAGVR
jgi:hypothetical protein